MAHSITGKGGSISLAASPLSGKVLGWEHHYIGEQVPDTGAGDLYVSRLPTFIDWEATLEAEFPATAYTTQAALLNAVSALVLKVNTSDSASFFAGSGIVTNILSTLRHDQIVTYRMTMKGDGSTPGTP